MRVWHNGDRYNGDWSEGKRHGNGALKYANGRSYVGGFAHSRRSGYGVFIWEDGHKYSGMWANGERNGKGVYIAPEEFVPLTADAWWWCTAVLLP